MRKRRRVEKPAGEESRSRGVGRLFRLFASSPLRLFGPRLIVAAWLVLVMVVYFRLQLERVLKMVGVMP